MYLCIFLLFLAIDKNTYAVNNSTPHCITSSTRDKLVSNKYGRHTYGAIVHVFDNFGKDFKLFQHHISLLSLSLIPYPHTASFNFRIVFY